MYDFYFSGVGSPSGGGVSMDVLLADFVEQPSGESILVATGWSGPCCRVRNDPVLDSLSSQSKGPRGLVGMAHLLSECTTQHGSDRNNLIFRFDSSNVASLGISCAYGFGDTIHGNTHDPSFHPVDGIVLTIR